MKALQKVAKRWPDVAHKVGFTSSEVAGLESDYREVEVGECLSHIVGKWWERDQQLTWEKVVNLLMALGEGEQATKLAEEAGS